MKRDAQGNIYFCGSFNDFIQLGDIRLEESIQDWDGYLAKMTPQGKVEWARQLHATSRGDIKDLDIDSEGNVVVCGTFFQRIEENGNVILPGLGERYSQAFVAYYAADGARLWIKEFGNEWPDYGEKVLIGSNAVYFGSTYQDATRYGTNEFFGKLVPNVLLSKLSISGDLIWVKHVGEISVGGSVADIRQDANGDIYILTAAQIDYADSHIPPNTFTQLQKIKTQDGTLGWELRANPGVDQLALRDSDIYLAGVFTNYFYTGQTVWGTNSINGPQIGLAKIASDGSVLDVAQLGGSDDELVDTLDVEGDRAFLELSTSSSDFKIGSTTLEKQPGTNMSSFVIGLSTNLEAQWATPIGSFQNITSSRLIYGKDLEPV